jgi:exopolysaccharide biosynthesis polyprenyl glycosylphosphotransferase
VSEAGVSPARTAFVPPWLRHAIRTVLHFILDAAAVAAAWRLAYLWRFQSAIWNKKFQAAASAPYFLHEKALWLVIPLFIFLIWRERIYQRSWMDGYDRFLKIARACLLGTGAVMLATFIVARLDYSRLMMLLFFPASVAALTISQFLALALDGAVKKFERAKPVLIIGTDRLAKLLKQRIQARHPNAGVSALAEMPRPEKLEAALRLGDFYELIVSATAAPHEQVLVAADLCEKMNVQMKVLPSALESKLGAMMWDDGLGLPAFTIRHAALSGPASWAKRIFDLIFSSIFILCASPFIALIALLIKLDSKGPVFYQQTRVGLKGKEFGCYKFRTMIAGADALKAGLAERNERKGHAFKIKNDPRVTRVGRALRRLSLDEVPQFFNVFRGEMSVVGPRPPVPVEVKNYGKDALKRLDIMPGITGLWQVSGRSDLDFEQMLELDFYYIEHWSLGLDLRIILKTVPAIFSAKGAY